MNLHDIQNKADVEVIINDFYAQVIIDPIIGFIFTDVAKINLDSHLPLITNFWFDILFRKSQQNTKSKSLYSGNVLQKHLELHTLIKLKPGHFTRWLYLFSNSIDSNYSGPNCDLMKKRAESIAETISAAITSQKKGFMKIVLPKK